MDITRARALAQDFIDKMSVDEPHKLLIDDSATMDIGQGWVFFYNTKAYLERRNFLDQLAGNAPLIVNKLDESIYTTGTAFPIEHYIQRFKKTGRP